jgi:TDG/mug DNA glycosylase family protein
VRATPAHEVRVEPGRVPLELARLHRTLAVGDRVRLVLAPARPGPGWDAERIHDAVVGAGFTDAAVRRPPADTRPSPFAFAVGATRARSLPDTVRPGMRVLVCGLNPSLYAADAGIGFARPGNRFWPAALAAGLVSRDRDPDHALCEHGVGMTDIVKRATVRADELSTAEYESGLGRVERLVSWLEPGVICFVGLDGWRRVVDRRAQPGPQERRLGGVRVHLMPSTSGLNAHSSLAALTEHLRSVAAGATPIEDRR